MTNYIALNNHTVYRRNIKNANGNRLRKDKLILTGETFRFIERFESTCMATHGASCLKLSDSAGNILIDYEKYYTKQEIQHDS